MTSLAALALSLASAVAPAADSTVAAAGAPALESPRAQGEAELGETPTAPGADGSTEARINGTPNIGKPIIGIQNIGTATIGSSIAGTANIGTPNSGAANIGGELNPAGPRGGFPVAPLLPVLGLALCGAAAMVFARKKQVAPKLLQIVETHGLGGRRSLIVARIAGETLLLGSSEAGLALILARPGETVAQGEAAMARESSLAQAPLAAEPPRAAPRIPSALTNSWLGRLRLARTQEQAAEAPEPSFEELLERDAQARAQARARSAATNLEPALLRQPLDPLAESAEDQELRRKLAQGRSGRIA